MEKRKKTRGPFLKIIWLAYTVQWTDFSTAKHDCLNGLALQKGPDEMSPKWKPVDAVEDQKQQRHHHQEKPEQQSFYFI
jgi:hypothetical protein